MVSGWSSWRWTSGAPSMSQTPGTCGGCDVEVVDVLLGGRADAPAGQPLDEPSGASTSMYRQR